MQNAPGGSILQYFRPSLSYYLSLSSLFCLFLSGRLRQVLLQLQRGKHFIFSYKQVSKFTYLLNDSDIKTLYHRSRKAKFLVYCLFLSMLYVKINNFSVMLGHFPVFLSCSRTQNSASQESQARGPLIPSLTLYHCAPFSWKLQLFSYPSV